MLAGLLTLLESARASQYAIGGFNVYNLEGVTAVIEAAELESSPVILQLHPASLKVGGIALISACTAAAVAATIPVCVHLDHASSETTIRTALQAGATSIMADGSGLPYEHNVKYTKAMTSLVHDRGASVEAELGRISGSEDGISISDLKGRMTDPIQAVRFVRDTGIDALAVCIGNVHGRYPCEPRLDFARLEALRDSISVPLVLHGASGLPEFMIRRSIKLGIAKFNVNTEVREAYLARLRHEVSNGAHPELLWLISATTSAMRDVVRDKIRLFGSSGQRNLK